MRGAARGGAAGRAEAGKEVFVAVMLMAGSDERRPCHLEFIV